MAGGIVIIGIVGIAGIGATIRFAINNHKSTNELTSKIEQLEQKVDKSQTTLTAESIEAIEQRVEETETKIRDTGAELTKLSSKTNSCNDGFANAIRTHEDRLKRLEGSAKTNTNTITTTLNKAVKDITEIGQRVDTLQTKLTQLTEETEKMRGEIRSEFVRIERKVSDFESEADRIEKEIKGTGERISDLENENEVDKVKKSLEAVEDRLKELSDANTENQADIKAIIQKTQDGVQESIDQIQARINHQDDI